MRIHLFLCMYTLLYLCCGSLHAGQLPTDTLLSRYYEKAANLMGEGEYDSAQYYFDKAFATPKATKSPVYPVLLNEQATLLIYRRIRQGNGHEKASDSLSAAHGRHGETHQRI